MAREQGFDLVEVAPSAKPPVCRIMDFSKYKYIQEKRQRDARKRQKVFHKKEIKLKPNIERHDYLTKIKQAEKFMSKGDKVKFTMCFRGREFSHVERGREVLDRIATDLSAIAELETPATHDGKNIIMIMMPKSK